MSKIIQQQKRDLAIEALKTVGRLYGQLVPADRFKGQRRAQKFAQIEEMENAVFEALDTLVEVEVQLVEPAKVFEQPAVEEHA